jgi:hypothetical protein
VSALVREAGASTWGNTMSEHTFELTDEGGRKLKVRVGDGGQCLEVMPEGYGEKNAEDGMGAPVLLDWCAGKLRVVVLGDIKSEKPTHHIDLAGARESERDQEGD